MVRLEPAVLDHRAVDLDVRLAEIDVAADDGLAAKRAFGADADDPAVAEALSMQSRDERVLDRFRVRTCVRFRRRAAAAGEQEGCCEDRRRRTGHGVSTTFVASRESKRR